MTMEFRRIIVGLVLAIALIVAVLVPASASPDIDVLYITRTPRYQRNVSLEKCDANPNDQNSQPTTNLTELSKQRWPKTGQKVTFTAVIKNAGNAATGAFDYKWYFDGAEVGSGTIPSLAPGESATTSWQWVWDSVWNDHYVKFAADPMNAISENVEANNIREDRTNSFSFCALAWESVYSWFATDVRSHNSNLASFEDYIQMQIGYINQLYREAIWPTSPDGVFASMRLDMVEIIPEATPSPIGNHDTDFQGHLYWDGVWGFAPNEYPRIFVGDEEDGPHEEFLDGPFSWVLHEWGHQQGLIDLYKYDSASVANAVMPYGHESLNSCMMTGNEMKYSAHTAGALNSSLHERRGLFGEYQYDLPETCSIRVLDAYGHPLPNATVKFYQSKNSDYSGDPDFIGTTDANGYYAMPNRYCWAWDGVNNRLAPDHRSTTITGHTLHDNPWGQVTLTAYKNCFFCEITSASGAKDYQFLEMTPYNLAYWAGHTQEYTYDFQTVLLDSRPTTNNLYGIKMTSDTHGYAVGAGGIILKWNGTTWSSMTSPTVNNLKAVDALSATGYACAVGVNGTVLTSVNGTSWIKQTNVGNPPTTANLNTCEFISSTTVIVGGDGGALYRGVRGTNSWTWTRIYGVSYGIKCIRFCDSSKGIMTCDQGKVYYTNNGGLNWLPAIITLISGNPMTSCSMPSATEAYCCNNDGDVYKSTDGGYHWTQIADGCWIDDWNSMEVRPGGIGWIVGGIYDDHNRGLILRYDPGFKTRIEAVTGHELQNENYCVSSVSDTEAWVVGKGGLIYHIGPAYPSDATDKTAPIMGPVNDPGDVTYNYMAVTANWTATDAQSKVVAYQYAVGTSPTDPGSGYLIDWKWTEDKSVAVDLSSPGMESGETYYFYVKARNRLGLWSNVAVSNGVTVIIGNTSDIKQAPAGSSVAIEAKVATGNLGPCFYVQETDRSSGIRVESPDGPESGTLTSVWGTIQSIDGEAAIIDPVITTEGVAEVKPVGLNNKAIGGSGEGLQQATWINKEGSWSPVQGLNNTGLLVTTTGTVTYNDPAGLFAYIDDGSGVTDGNTLGVGGTPAPGIRVTLGNTGAIKGIAPAAGSKLVVTGVASTRPCDSKLVSTIRVRNQADLRSVIGAVISGNIYRPITSQDNSVGSPHPYQNNYHYMWTITAPVGTTGMRLHFTQVGVHGNDFVYYCAPGGQLRTISNTDRTDFWTEWIPGNKINLFLYTDASDVYYGVQTDRYEIEGGPLSGAMVTLSPGGITTTTNAMGNYAFFDIPDGTYTITPSMTGKVFSPLNLILTIINGHSVDHADFTSN